jgi:hypothetical protein
MFATLFDDPDMVNRMLDRYLSVEADAVRAVAADVFAADNRAVLTYLPLAPTADEQVGPTVRPVEDADDADEEEEEEAA